MANINISSALESIYLPGVDKFFIYSDYRAYVPYGDLPISAGVDYLKVPNAEDSPVSGAYITKKRMPQYTKDGEYAQTDINWDMGYGHGNRTVFYESFLAPVDTTNDISALYAQSGVCDKNGSSYILMRVANKNPSNSYSDDDFTYYVGSGATSAEWYTYKSSAANATSGNWKELSPSGNVSNLLAHYGAYRTNIDGEISNGWLVGNPWSVDGVTGTTSSYDFSNDNISAYCSNRGDGGETFGPGECSAVGSVELKRPSALSYDVDSRFFSLTYSVNERDTSLSLGAVPMCLNPSIPDTFSVNRTNTPSVYKNDVVTPNILSLEVKTGGDETSLDFSMSRHANIEGVPGAPGDTNSPAKWFDMSPDGWWGSTYKIHNRKKYIVSAEPVPASVLGSDCHFFNSNFETVSPDMVEVYKIVVKPGDGSNDDEYRELSESAFSIDIGDISAFENDKTKIYVEGDDSYDEGMFYQLTDGQYGFIPFYGLRVAVEYLSAYDEDVSSTYSQTFRVPTVFANAGNIFSAAKALPTADLVLTMGEAVNPPLDYSYIEIEDKTPLTAGHEVCVLHFSIDDGNFDGIVAEGARSCEPIDNTTLVEIRMDPHGTLRICNASDTPLTMSLSAASAVWRDNRYKSASYGTASAFSLSGLYEVPNGEWILASPHGICSDSENAVYCGITDGMAGFTVSSANGGSLADIPGAVITDDSASTTGKAHTIRTEASANGVRKYSYFTAYDVPEIEYCDGFNDWNFRVVPEYGYNFVESTGRDVGWYRNGWSVNEDTHAYYFGTEYALPPYVISDGNHTERVFYRLNVPPEMTGYKSEASLYLSAEEDSGWVLDNKQISEATSAIQYVYNTRKGIGADTRKNYRSKIEFDFIDSFNKNVFRDIPSVYHKIVDGQIEEFHIPTAFTTQLFESNLDDIRSGGASVGGYGVSYIPTTEFISPTGSLDGYVYFPVSGYVGTDTVVDKRIFAPDGDSISIDSPAMAGTGVSAGSLFPGNTIGIYHDSAGISAPGIQRNDYLIEYYVASVKDAYVDDIDFLDEAKNNWLMHGISRNDSILATLNPTYYEDEKLGIVRERNTLVAVSAKKVYSVAIIASIPASRSFNMVPAVCNDWKNGKAELSVSASKILWAPPKIRFITPVVVANLNEGGSVPWYNESKVENFDYFDVRGTNTDTVTRLRPTDTVYKMSGFEEPGYYGIDTSGYVSAYERDNLNPDIYRVKQIIEEYHSVDDIWVETFGVWSSAVLRTPLSQKIQLDYTMTDLAIGPNETITNDVLNRRFEMLQHDLEQVESISRYYKNPPTKYLGYVGYGDDSIASAQYSEKTEISINNHYGFWSAGDNDENHRLDWQWCWQSEGEFTCPSARNSTIDTENFSPTIVYGATDVFIDDATMNIYVTSGSTFTLGGMSTYTQTYKTEDDVRKFRDYADVNGSAPKLSSIRVMDDGNVVVLAPDFNRVLVYSRFDESESGRKDIVFKYDFGGLGGANANLRFNRPIELAIDSGKFSKWGQLVYVLDSGNNCIKVFNIAGAFIAKIGYELKEWAAEHAVSLTVSWDGTICLLTNMRVLFFNLDGESTGEFTLDRTDPLQICANKNANFVYILYDDDVLKISATGLLIGNFSVSDKWHKIGSYMLRGIPPYFGKIRRMATTKFDQIYLVLDNIVLIYADLLTEMSLAASTYRDMQWDIERIKIGRDEYMQDFVVNIAFHRMYDNINLFRKAIYGTLRVYEKNGIKYLRTNNLSEGEFALMNEIPSKGEVFVALNAPMSGRAFNDNIQKLYDIIVKLLEWCQANL